MDYGLEDVGRIVDELGRFGYLLEVASRDGDYGLMRRYLGCIRRVAGLLEEILEDGKEE